MKILELFSGQGSISAAFKENGFEAFRVDWSHKVEAELHMDIKELTAELVAKYCQGIPDVIWASPQCTTYSIGTHRHRTLQEGLKPKTLLAANDDETNVIMWGLIDDLLKLGTKYYFVENPRGRMRHMPFVQNRPRYTITYCSYGNKGNAKGYEHYYVMKPTDIWTNHPHPKFKPMCKINNPEHEHFNQGAAMKRDYLSRGQMPKDLTKHIANICANG